MVSDWQPIFIASEEQVHLPGHRDLGLTLVAFITYNKGGFPELLAELNLTLVLQNNISSWKPGHFCLVPSTYKTTWLIEYAQQVCVE